MTTTEEPIGLSLFSPDLFPDRAALRAYIASEAFEEMAEAAWIALDPGSFHPDDTASRQRHAFRWALRDLVQDLLHLARAAAAEGPPAFTRPGGQERRAASAVALISRLSDDIAYGVIETFSAWAGAADCAELPEDEAPEDRAGEAIEGEGGPGAADAEEEASAADAGDEVTRIELDYLNPELFPDPNSVRMFVEGNGVEAMLYALVAAVKPENELAPHVMAAARKPIYFLAKDILTLLRAHIAGKPVSAERGMFWQEHGRNALALVMLPDHWADDLQQEILRYLVDPPEADTEPSAAPGAGEAPEHAAAEVA